VTIGIFFAGKNYKGKGVIYFFSEISRKWYLL